MPDMHNRATAPALLTDRQREVFTLMTRYAEQYQEPPSVSFLARRLGLHPTTVSDHLQALCRKGWLPTARPWLHRRGGT